MTAGDLLRRLDAVDRRREAMLARAQAMDAEALVRRPRPDGWSELEIIEHLVLAERSVLRDLRPTPPPPPPTRPRRVRLKHRLGYALVLAILRFGVPVRVPSPAMQPSGGRTLDELRAMWDENHRWLRSYLEGLDGAGLRHTVFRHPVSGPLNAVQAVRMLDVHLTRHEAQIAKLRRVVGGAPQGGAAHDA